MSAETWLAYLATVLILMSTPGPSHLLMLSTSVVNGFRKSIATAAGDLTANILQILAAGSGLAALLRNTQYGFTAVKWAGVAYLAFLGVGQIRRSFRERADTGQALESTARELWLRGFLTSAANPKAIIFFAALFPQFIDGGPGSGPGLGRQLAILGVTYLLIDAAFLCGYGLFAGWLASRLRRSGRAVGDRLAGGFLIVAALLLGLKSVQGS